jgi:biopolymer transport protein ExbD
MTTGESKTAAPTAEKLAAEKAARNFRRAKRKVRVEAGEVSELNITAMMDMMTIILVFLLKSYAASAISLTQSEDVKPPISSTRAVPKDTVAVTITPRDILVGDRVVVQLENGQVPAAMLQGRLVTPLDQALRREVDKLKLIAARNPAAPFSRELSVIGDRRIPYDLLLTVLYTAGQAELENYRFVVLQKGDGSEG